ncbi:MAG: S-methyl-5'-thioadenosine phosphorylase [Planctomycetes bacterium]|nr:S-methyl-5'-thioadenosine phosphorylase [Planctomycetota bacterium]
MKIGVLGGSGLYEIDGLQDVQEVGLATPFGAPSDVFLTGRLDGVDMVFLPRHGRGHRLTPSEINYRANIWGLKSLGVTHVVAVSAVGSMREEIAPGDFVLIDQFIDRTRHRKDTFFGGGVVAHVMFGDPVCEGVRGALMAATAKGEVKVHDGGTYLCMEGPQFSTRAESELYRSWNVDVIGMTNLTEAKLAREAELCYATLAMATDYDCWHDGHDEVTVDAIVATMKSNVEHARQVIRAMVSELAKLPACHHADALANAMLTDPTTIDEDTRTRMELLIGRYLENRG